MRPSSSVLCLSPHYMLIPIRFGTQFPTPHLLLFVSIPIVISFSVLFVSLHLIEEGEWWMKRVTLSSIPIRSSESCAKTTSTLSPLFRLGKHGHIIISSLSVQFYWILLLCFSCECALGARLELSTKMCRIFSFHPLLTRFLCNIFYFLMLFILPELSHISISYSQ